MPQYFLDPNQSLDARKKQLDQRQFNLLKQAQDAMRYAVPSRGQMVGGQYIGPSWTQMLVPLANRVSDRWAQSDLDKAQTQYDMDERRAAEELVSRLNKGVSLPGPVQPGEAPITRPLTPEERLPIYAEGRNIPSLRDSLAKAFDDALIQEPIRAENRQFKAEEAAENRQFKAEEARARAEERLQELRHRLEDRKLDRDSREQLAREARDLQRTIAAQASADRRYAVDTNAQLRRDLDAAVAKATGKAAKADEAAAKRATSADEALDLLDAAEKLLPSATNSYLGYGVDQAARAFGKSTEGSKATAALQTIGGQLVAKMPRMEGPQSNYDVQLYQQMAGRLDDPTVPLGDRQAALKTLRALNQKYAGRSGATPRGPQVGTVVDGYTFKGGDPADPKNWSK